MTSYRYVGTDAPRPDAPAKATGRAAYIHDLARPGMLYGKIKFSEHAHARIKHIDISKAEKLPGVRAVITAYNTPEVRVGFMRDNFALKRDNVRQFRDEIAAVAAIDPDIAAAAIELIEVEYEPLPVLDSPEQALEPDAVLIHETDPRGKPRQDNRLALTYRHESGDLIAGRRAAKHIVQGEFTTPRIQQSCLGTAGCIAEFDPFSNLTLWAKTQIPFLAQRDFNRALGEMGLRGKNSRVIVPALGGGFGSGLDTHCYEYIAILLAWRTGLPVKIVYSRDEEFAFLSPRQSSTVRIEQGCDENGKLTFRRSEVLLDNGAYTSWGATYPSVMMLPATSLYRVANVYFDAALVYTNNTYCQAMRGYGNPELAWALESTLDELAIKAGIDPLDIRLLNCNEPGETTPMGLQVTSCGLRQCLESAGGKIDWHKRRPAYAAEPQEESSEALANGRKRRGIGLAALMHVGGSGRIYRSDASGVILRLDDFGNLYVSSGGVEMGQGFHSALSLMVAEAVGVRPDKVFINQTDTATCPWDVGTHASRGAFTAGNAVKMAAEKLRERLFGQAEIVFANEVARNLKKHQKKHPDYQPPQFDVVAAAKKDNFDLFDGYLVLRDGPDEPWLRVELGRLLRAVHFREKGEMFTVEALYDPPSELPDWTKGVGNMSATYSYGVQAVEVEVDLDTGDIKILRVVSIHDVGKVLNQQTLKGQTYGGLVQGIGYALYEQILTEGGRILNPDFRDYKIPTFGEIDFPIDIQFIETDDEHGPFGAKGVGEPGLVPTAPAIANAVYHAAGVRLRDLPMTPEAVRAALAKDM